jgi:hypothetical protein
MSFQDKVAIVTGAASGIGEATAKRLASLGADVVVADIEDQAGVRVVQQITEAGGSASFKHADITSENEVAELIDHAVTTFGGMHLAHNNAGVTHGPTPIEDMDLALWNQVLSINVTGTFLCLRAEIAHMLAHGGGAIVNTASGAGLKGVPDLPAYVASKHAVVGLTRSAALSYVSNGIRVNAIAPGTIATPMITSLPVDLQAIYAQMMPMGRLGQPTEVADLAVYLLSEQASYITGTTVEVDGGFMQTSKG